MSDEVAAAKAAAAEYKSSDADGKSYNIIIYRVYFCAQHDDVMSWCNISLLFVHMLKDVFY